MCHSQRERKCINQGGCRAAVPMQCRGEGLEGGGVQPASRAQRRKVVFRFKGLYLVLTFT